MVLSKKKIDLMQLILLLTISFLGQITINMVNLDVVYHLRAIFHMPAGLIGIAVGVSAISFCIACLTLLGFLSKFRPRNVIMCGFLFLGLTTAVFAKTTNQALVWVILVLFGAFQAFIWTYIESWIIRGKEGKELNKVLMLFNLSWSLGTGISPYICTVLVEKNTFLPLQVSAFMFFIVACILFVVSTLFPQIRSVDGEKTYIAKSEEKDHSTPLRYFAWVGIFLGYLALTGVQTAFPLYAGEVLHWSESTTGVLLLVRGVASCFLFIFLGQTVFWHFKLSHLLFAQIAIALLLFAFKDITSFVPLVFFFLFLGIFYAVTYVESIFHGASGALDRAKRMNYHEVILNIGIIAGGACGGTLYQHFGYPSMMEVTAIILAVSVLIQIFVYQWFMKKKRYVRLQTETEKR